MGIGGRTGNYGVVGGYGGSRGGRFPDAYGARGRIGVVHDLLRNFFPAITDELLILLNLAFEIGDGTAVGAEEGGVLFLNERPDALVVPDVRAGSDKERLAGLWDRLVSMQYRDYEVEHTATGNRQMAHSDELTEHESPSLPPLARFRRRR